MKRVSVLLVIVLVIFLGACQAPKMNTHKEEEPTVDFKYTIIPSDSLPYQMVLLNAEIKDNYSFNKKKMGYNWYILDNQSILVIGLGERDTEGYTVEVKSVQKTGDTVNIVVEEKKPEIDKLSKQEKTYPSITIKLDEIPKNIQIKDIADIKFELDNKKEVRQQDINRVLAKCVYSEDLLCISDYGKYGFIDKTGKVIIDFKYDTATDFSNGLSMISLNKKYGIINKSGDTVISPLYDEKIEFINNEAIVKRDGKIGIIDKAGNVIIECKYDSITTFNENNLAIVSYMGRKGVINKQGQTVIEAIYDDIEFINKQSWNDRLQLTSGQFSGIADLFGNVIIPVIYEKNIIFYDNGTALFIKIDPLYYSETTHLIDRSGRVLKW